MNDVLEQFLNDATSDDYPSGAPPSQPPTGALRTVFTGGLVVVSALLLGVVVVSAAVSFRATADVRGSTREALIERVRTLTADVEQERQEAAELAANVDALRLDLLEDGDDEVRRREMASLEQASGVSELTGPGINVTIDDAPNAATDSLNRVLDRDLQGIVNALWQMGARGITINDQRLTATSAIRGAGQAILVNYTPLTRPYTVSAVGTSSAGPGSSDLQTLLDVLSDDYGLVSSVEVGDVALPAGELADPRYARTAPVGPVDTEESS